MEIATPVILGCATAANALWTYLLSTRVKSDEERIKQGGEQLNRMLEECDKHSKYIYNFQIICGEYNSSYKDIYNRQFLKKIQDYKKYHTNYFIFKDQISEELKSEINEIINMRNEEENNNIEEKIYLDKITDIQKKLDDNNIKYIFHSDYIVIKDDILLFFIYCILGILSWIQIRNKSNDYIHSSFSNENKKLQELIDEFSKILNNNSENKLSIPINLQKCFGNHMINEKMNENNIEYKIIDFFEFKNIINNHYLNSNLDQRNIHLFDHYRTDDKIVEFWGINYNCEKYNEWLKKEFEFIKHFNDSFSNQFFNFYYDSVKIQIYLSKEKENEGEWYKIFVFLFYTTIWSIFNEDIRIKGKDSQLKKNFNCFIEDLKNRLHNEDNEYQFIDDSRYKHEDFDIDKLWLPFVKKKIEEKYGLETFKNMQGENKSEYDFFEKIIKFKEYTNYNLDTLYKSSYDLFTEIRGSPTTFQFKPIFKRIKIKSSNSYSFKDYKYALSNNILIYKNDSNFLKIILLDPKNIRIEKKTNSIRVYSKIVIKKDKFNFKNESVNTPITINYPYNPEKLKQDIRLDRLDREDRNIFYLLKNPADDILEDSYKITFNDDDEPILTPDLDGQFLENVHMCYPDKNYKERFCEDDKIYIKEYIDLKPYDESLDELYQKIKNNRHENSDDAFIIPGMKNYSRNSDDLVKYLDIRRIIEIKEIKSSLFSILENDIRRKEDRECIDYFKDLFFEFILKDKDEIFKNISDICFSVIQESEKIIKEDIKYRKDLLKII